MAMCSWFHRTVFICLGMTAILERKCVDISLLDSQKRCIFQHFAFFMEKGLILQGWGVQTTGYNQTHEVSIQT